MYIWLNMAYAQLLIGLGALVNNSDNIRYSTVMRYGMKHVPFTIPMLYPATAKKKYTPARVQMKQYR